MGQKNENEAIGGSVDWIAVIARSLAYLSLRKAQQDNPKEFENVLAKVEFLEGLGLSQEDAAKAVGSTLNSVQVMRSRKKGGSRGKK